MMGQNKMDNCEGTDLESIVYELLVHLAYRIRDC